MDIDDRFTGGMGVDCCPMGIDVGDCPTGIDVDGCPVGIDVDCCPTGIELGDCSVITWEHSISNILFSIIFDS